MMTQGKEQGMWMGGLVLQNIRWYMCGDIYLDLRGSIFNS